MTAAGLAHAVESAWPADTVARRLLVGALAPAAAAYGAGVAVRNRLYDRSLLAAARVPATVLSVGNVTVTQRQALLDGILRVAWALDEMVVIAQHPDAGTLVSAVDPPPVDLEAEAPPQAIPEPATLLLFATGLAFIAVVLVRRRG